MRNRNASHAPVLEEATGVSGAGAAPLGSLGLTAASLPRTRPVYRHIAHAIEHGITNGTLTLDFRLPAERELARALKVSRTTVVNAYRDLETRGLGRGHVGRGTFVSAAPEASGAPFAWRGKSPPPPRARAIRRFAISSGTRRIRRCCRSRPACRRSRRFRSTCTAGPWIGR